RLVAHELALALGGEDHLHLRVGGLDLGTGAHAPYEVVVERRGEAGERGLGRDDLDAVDGEDVVQDHRRHAARQAPEEGERGDAHGDAERRQDEVAHVALEVLAEDAPERARAHHAAASSATITPSTILTTRAAASETRSSWVTMSSVVRSFRFSSWKNSMTSRPVWVSRL